MTEHQMNEFNELAMEHMDAIYSAALKLTPNTARAEDLVHRTFFVAYNMFNLFERNSNFEDWITDICRKTFKYPSIIKNYI